MLVLLPTQTPLLNGYSGYFPALNGQLKRVLADFPSPETLVTLRALGVRSVLVDVDALDPDDRARLARLVDGGALAPRGLFVGLPLFEVPGARLSPASEYEGPWSVDVHARGGRLELRLRPRALGERVYVVSPRTAPLELAIRVQGPDGRSSQYRRTVRGAWLLHPAAPADLVVAIPRPEPAGRYAIELGVAPRPATVGRATVWLAAR